MVSPAGFNPAEMSTMQRNALLRQGEAILKNNPRDKAMLAQVGLLYLANNDVKTAIDRFQAALKLDKRNVLVIGELVNVHNRLRQYTVARKYARKLIEIAPREAEYQKAYAETLENCGQYEKALEVWQRLIHLNPAHAEPPAQMARCLRTMGRMKEALDWYAKVLEIEPFHAEALYMIAQSRRFSPEEATGMLENIEKSAAVIQEDIERANLFYAAGKILSDVGRNDEAFAFFNKANESRRPADPDERQAEFAEALKKTQNGYIVYDKALFTSKANVADPWDAPIFILGMPRSGTTLTESLVAGHSQVIAGDELAYMSRITKGVGQSDSDAGAISELLACHGKSGLCETGRNLSRNPLLVYGRKTNILPTRCRTIFNPWE